MTISMNFEQLSLGFSKHAVKRSSQRGIKPRYVANILKFGRKNYQNGAVITLVRNEDFRLIRY